MKLIFILSLILGCFEQNIFAEGPLFFSTQMIETHLSGYDKEEKTAIMKDLAIVRDVCFSGKHENPERPFYLATAGAPGARKSTILERFLITHPEYAEGVYTDPDQRALKFMVHTYYTRSLNALANASHEKYQMVQKAAYEKWRGASNYIALIVLEEAFQGRFNVIHGSTSTGGHIPLFFEKLKKAGYSLNLILCSCEDSLRAETVNYRCEEQKIYQSTPEDALSKGKFFAQKMEHYFQWADSLYLFWSDALLTPERLAATYINKTLTIHDQEAYSNFVSKYERDRQAFHLEGIEIPSWKELF